MLMQEVARFQNLQSRRFEARRGLSGQRTKRTYGDSKLDYTVLEVPARLNLKQLVPVLPRWKFKPQLEQREIAADQKKLDKTKLEAGLNASLELQRRKPWKLEQNTSTGFEAGLERLKAMKLEQNNMTKKRP